MGATSNAAAAVSNTAAKPTAAQESEALNALLTATEKDLKATKEEMAALKLAESKALFIDLDAAQSRVTEYFELEHKELQKMATSAFASVLRGKVQSAINKCIVEKHNAFNKGRTNAVAELAEEITILEKLKADVS